MRLPEQHVHVPDNAHVTAAAAAAPAAAAAAATAAVATAVVNDDDNDVDNNDDDDDDNDDEDRHFEPILALVLVSHHGGKAFTLGPRGWKPATP